MFCFCKLKLKFIFAIRLKMVVVAQLVRVPDCGSGGRRFEPGLPPKLMKNRDHFDLGFFIEITFKRKNNH